MVFHLMSKVTLGDPCELSWSSEWSTFGPDWLPCSLAWLQEDPKQTEHHFRGLPPPPPRPTPRSRFPPSCDLPTPFFDADTPACAPSPPPPPTMAPTALRAPPPASLSPKSYTPKRNASHAPHPPRRSPGWGWV